MNYYRRYIGDYARDTMALSLAEHGAYTLLLDAYYANEQPLPADVGKLYRICRATDKVEQAAVEAVAEKFFPADGDGSRHNKRADRELGKAKDAIAQMSDAGKQGAAKRWRKHAGTDAGADAGRDAGGIGVPHAGADADRDRGRDAGAGAGADATTNHQPPTTSPQPPAISAKADAHASMPDRDYLWGPALQAMQAQNVPETQARALIGKALSVHGERDAAAAIRGYIADATIDLKSRIAAFNRRAKRTGKARDVGLAEKAYPSPTELAA